MVLTVYQEYLNYLRTRMRNLLLVVCFVGFFTSCVKETDSEKPVVSIVTPAQDEVVFTADDLRIVAELSDNSGILQFKIVVSGIDSLNDIAKDTTYSIIYIDAVPDDAAQHSFDFTIDLPDSTFNGHYQLTMACVDVEGNQSYNDTVLFEIRNSFDSQPPSIDVFGPSTDTLRFGEGFSPSGMITDDVDLTYASIYIGTTSGSDTLHWFDFPEVQNNEVSFNTGQNWWQVDSAWVQGSYHVYLTAWDRYSGVSHSIPFYVKY